MSNLDVQGARAVVSEELVPLVDGVRRLQHTDGRVIGDQHLAADLLERMRQPVRRVLHLVGGGGAWADAFDGDLDRWLGQGLDSAPRFDATLAGFQPPADGGAAFFVAPLVTPNGPGSHSGHFFECFLAVRQEPAECQTVAALLPHPKNRCQSMRFMTGSAGLRTGNCIVFFPENVALAVKPETQAFAAFFFNKFQRIYLNETLPRVASLTGSTSWESGGQSAEECYRARSVWGYLHDYFHHQGLKPIDAHLAVKLNFFVGLLEEIKVDCQSAIAARDLRLPFWREIGEFILFERLFRYPAQPDAVSNFDAGTGMLLFEWLLAHGGGICVDGERLVLDVEACLDSAAGLVAEIEALEAAAEDDMAYRRLAREYVRTILPAGGSGTRFSVPHAYGRLVGFPPSAPHPLEFDDLSF